MREQCFILRL